MTQRRPTLLNRLRGWVLTGLTLAVTLGLFLVGTVLVGRLTRERVRDGDRYVAAFADIDCPPPPAQSRADFLAEVQYLADHPDRLYVLDDNLTRRLAAAFASHPWVQKVQRVEIVPPRQVRVRLTYRIPVLAVSWPKQVRALDGQAVLLPANAPTEGLPILRGPVTLPAGAAGKVCGDPGIANAARTLGLLHPHKEQLRLTAVAAKKDVLTLTTAGGTRVLWGHGPGAEAAGEVPAAQKCERLLGYCGRHGGLDKPAGPYLYDVRPTDKAVHRPLPKS